MKLMHIADLHLGKMVNGFSMRKDQEVILKEMIQIMEEEMIQGVLIAGDVYDRSIPSTDAVELLNDFLTQISNRGILVFMVTGNHDSGQRLSFGTSLFQKNGIYIVGQLSLHIPFVDVEDEYGIVRVWLLPFFKPAQLRLFNENADIENYESAMKSVLEEIDLDTSKRNIMMTHHFITSKNTPVETSDSENIISIGGVDNIDYRLFDDFDYVALGHIHGPQKVGRDTVRYAGSPLKYSFSEEFHHKSVVIIELKEKGDITYNLHPLHPLHDMRKIKGELKDLIEPSVSMLADCEDYLCVTLTDTDELLEPLQILRGVYPNVMQLLFEKKQDNMKETQVDIKKIKEKSPIQLVEGFFSYAAGRELDARREKLIKSLVEQAEGRVES